MPLSSKTSHWIEVAAVLLNAAGNLAASIAGYLSPRAAGIDVAIGVAALAVARGLSNINSGGPPSPGA